MAMTPRLTEEEDRALTEQAAREHRAKQEVAGAAILEYTSRRSRRRDDLLARIGREKPAHWSDLLTCERGVEYLDLDHLVTAAEVAVGRQTATGAWAW